MPGRLIKTGAAALAAMLSTFSADAAPIYSDIQIRFDTPAAGEGSGANSIRPQSAPPLPAEWVSYTITQQDLVQLGAVHATSDLTITATCLTKDKLGCKLVQDDEGLGVFSLLFFDDFQHGDIDGINDESILFTVQSDDLVKLAEFHLEDIDDNDREMFAHVDGALLTGDMFSVDCQVKDPGFPDDECDISLHDPMALSSFEIGTYHWNDNFRIEAFEFQIYAQHVPAPAAAWLLAPGLLALTRLRKRRA
ncbi:MAG: hypothetical protein ACFB22_10985 [Rhodothalassiaceae bacterium]